MIELLEPVGTDDERPAPDPENPMRKITLQVAFEPGGWAPERAAKVAELFDGLAPQWHERMTGARKTAFEDALVRGGPFPAGTCLEIGSGIGHFTPQLTAAFGEVVSVDLSEEMLRLAPKESWRVRADASMLPFAAGRFAVVVLVNMFLFPVETVRVLAPGGVVVWVNTHGPATPIHLSAEEVDAALPGTWTGVAADAGPGTWAAFRQKASVTGS